VLGSSALAPIAMCVAARPSRARQGAVCALNMWAYLAAYEMPHDDPERLDTRVRVKYPITIDKLLGLGVTPTVRLQRTFSAPDQINRFERLLVLSHWIWFAVPHASLGYILLRDPNRFASAAARMYTVFDVGAVFYWAIPTAPPWWAAQHGHLEERDRPIEVRRMMIEYGPQFWGDLWPSLYDLLGGNPLAAMPSLHFATSLMAAHLLAETGPLAGAVGSLYAGTLGLALVYLGEHYAADLLGGAVLAESVRWVAPRAVPPVQRWLRALNRLQALASGG
jgi:membrane-associated phospholipid phosphatase